MAAGRLMLERLRDLAGQQVSFAFETTLASRSFAPLIRKLLQVGYRFHLVFLSLPTAAVAVQRVASRVRMGGHAVPADVVRRRYHAGLHNFFRLYLPLATSWRMYDTSSGYSIGLPIAAGNESTTVVYDEALWERARREANHGT
jgi:predicted ABC-type ATPase